MKEEDIKVGMPVNQVSGGVSMRVDGVAEGIVYCSWEDAKKVIHEVKLRACFLMPAYGYVKPET